MEKVRTNVKENIKSREEGTSHKRNRNERSRSEKKGPKSRGFTEILTEYSVVSLSERISHRKILLACVIVRKNRIISHFFCHKLDI